jgi:hypothetical protein
MAIPDPVKHLLSMLAQASSPIPKKSCVVCNSGHKLQYLLLFDDEDPGMKKYSGILRCSLKKVGQGRQGSQTTGWQQFGWCILICTILNVQQAGPTSIQVGDLRVSSIGTETNWQGFAI